MSPELAAAIVALALAAARELLVLADRRRRRRGELRTREADAEKTDHERSAG